MNTCTLTKLRIANLLRYESLYDFALFLRMLRQCVGVSRRLVAHDTGLSKTKLFHLEYGHFMFQPKTVDLRTLANYYGIPWKMLLRKSELFIVQHKNRPKYASVKESFTREQHA